MKCALAVDGGGIRGRIPARVLKRLEQITGKSIAELFDLIVGTSTGGILTLGLTRPRPCGITAMYSAEQMDDFYVNDGPGIFNKRLLKKISSGFGLLDEKYDTPQIEEPLRRVLGYGMLSQAITKVVVSAYDLQRRTPIFFKSHKAVNDPAYDFPIWQIARGTAAAPTFFDPELIVNNLDKAEYPLVDGGVFATNVAMHAFAEAKALWPTEQIMVVSLGCGEALGPYNWKKLCTGELGWVVSLLDIMMQGSSATVDYHMRQMDATYYRLQPQLKVSSSDMDDASRHNLDALAQDADRLILENQAILQEIAARLTTRAVAANA